MFRKNVVFPVPALPVKKTGLLVWLMHLAASSAGVKFIEELFIIKTKIVLF